MISAKRNDRNGNDIRRYGPRYFVTSRDRETENVAPHSTPREPELESSAHLRMNRPPTDRGVNVLSGLRHRKVRRILWLILGLNVLVAAIKASAGVWSGSTALLADGLHSVFDGIGNVVGLVALGVASRPPDDDHPYGHQKGEVVAALVIAMMIMLGMLELGRQAWASFTAGTAVDVDVWTVGAAVTSLFISAGVSLYEKRASDTLDSEILAADAGHTASDALATVAVLGGLGLVHLGIGWGDLLATGLVLAVLGVTVISMLRRTVDVLMDLQRLSPDAVSRAAREVPGVISCHAIRSRGMPGHVQLDLHVTFEPSMSLADAGDRVIALREQLHDAFPDVRDIVIQLEPHLPEHLPGREQRVVLSRPGSDRGSGPQTHGGSGSQRRLH